MRFSLFAILALFLCLPLAASAAPLEISGWMPYWRGATSTADVLPHLNQLTEVNPFGYIVQNDGTLYDALGIDEEPWVSFIAEAKKKKVRVIPTVMWSNTNAIHTILSRTSSRIALEDRIAALAKEKGFDGIDINFENKKYEDRDYFSTFLKGLYQRMGKKWVMCSIEARTPVTSRYDTTPPPDATHYVNNFVAINKYCDRVRLMTYDQQTVDVKLNAAANNVPYIPISDPQWVKKVVKLAAQIISKKKLVIGVATYGYEWQVKPLSESGFRYDLLWALNPRYGFETATSYGTTPQRNSAGELSFMYVPTSTPVSDEGATLPPAQMPATTSPVTNALFAGPSRLDSPVQMNIVWWSDAQAIADKIALAKSLGVRGIAIFKLDGGEDQGLWDLFPAKALNR